MYVKVGCGRRNKMSIEKAKEFLAAMKEKEPDEALKEKAAAAKTEEEKIALAVDIAHEMGYDVTEADIREAIAQVQQEDFAPLDDDMLDGVSGGRRDKYLSSEKCPQGPKGFHCFEKTGNTRPGSWIGLIDDVEYRCIYCGKTYWGWF